MLNLNTAPLSNKMEHHQLEGVTSLHVSKSLKDTLAVTNIQKIYRGYVERLKLKIPQDKNIYEFDKEGYGYKIHPNQTREWGRCDQKGQFVSIYSMDSNGIVTFVAKPNKIIGHAHESFPNNACVNLFECDGKLILVEQWFDKRS